MQGYCFLPDETLSDASKLIFFSSIIWSDCKNTVFIFCIKQYYRTPKNYMSTCKECSMSLSLSVSLKKQLRTYSREMFTRIECFKSFSEAGSFKRHLRTHSREKARSHFVFKGCYKSFSVSISLTFCRPPTNSFRILKRKAPKNTFRREAICLKECSKSSSVSLKRQLGTKIRI